MLKMLKSDYVVGIKEAFKKKGKIYLIFEYFETRRDLFPLEVGPSQLRSAGGGNIIAITSRCSPGSLSGH